MTRRGRSRYPQSIGIGNLSRDGTGMSTDTRVGSSPIGVGTEERSRNCSGGGQTWRNSPKCFTGKHVTSRSFCPFSRNRRDALPSESDPANVP